MLPDSRSDEAKGEPGDAGHDGTDEGHNKEDREIDWDARSHWDCPKMQEQRVEPSASAVTLIDGVPRPAVNCVEQRHSRRKLCGVVTEHTREAEAGREQACRLWGEIEPARIRASNNACHAQERLNVEAELLDHDIEGGVLASVGPERPVNIEGHSIGVLGNTRNLGWGHEQEHGAGIDKPTDEPVTGHADNLRSRSCHPDGSSFMVARRDLPRSHQRLALLAPRLVTARKGLSLKALVAKPGGDRLTLRSATLAEHDQGLPGISVAPTLNAAGCVTLGSGDEPSIGVELLLSTHIRERRRPGKPDKAGKLCDGDLGRRGHDGVHLE